MRVWNNPQAGVWHRASGYTLFEILLTLGIIAIALGVTTPMITGSLSESPVETIVTEIQEVATATHREAVADGEARRIHLTDTGLQGAEGGMVLPEGWELEVRRFGETAFRKPGEAEFWEFNGAGICEPLEMMITNGEESLVLGFDPLSAEVLSDEG